LRAGAHEGPQRIRITACDGKIEGRRAGLGEAGLEEMRILQLRRRRDGDAVRDEARAGLQRRIRFMAIVIR
jgi:hypothetical protein